MNAVTSAQSGVSSAQAQTRHYLKGVFLILCGFGVGYLWLWGYAFSVMTSEAAILGNAGMLTLSPQFSIFLQLAVLWSGKLTLSQSIAYAWGWFNQTISLLVTLNLEFSFFGGKKHLALFKWILAAFMLLNSLADLNYGSVFGSIWQSWQPWAFAGICCFGGLAFGVSAVNLIVLGYKQIF